MTKFRMTTIALAAATSFGALSIASAPAFAGHGGGGHGGGMHIGHGGGFGGHWGGHRWGYRGYGFGYGVYTAYVPECYYVRRFGALIKVCE